VWASMEASNWAKSDESGNGEQREKGQDKTLN